jgi:hypothetical protein
MTCAGRDLHNWNQHGRIQQELQKSIRVAITIPGNGSSAATIGTLLENAG